MRIKEPREKTLQIQRHLKYLNSINSKKPITLFKVKMYWINQLNINKQKLCK